jgi:transposase-like protein
VNIRGKRMYLWRAVDDEGEVLDMIVQHRRDTAAALKLLRRLMWSQRMTPREVATDGLKSYVSALTELGLEALHRPGRLRENDRAENSHLPIRRRERKMQGFKSPHPLSDFSPLTPPSTTLSTPNVISSAAKHSEPSEPMRMQPGRLRPLFTEIWGQGTSAPSQS